MKIGMGGKKFRALHALMGATALAALAGCAGPRGNTGAIGLPGDPGATGSPGPSGSNGAPANIRLLDDKVCGWLPGNRAALNAFIQSNGAIATTYDPSNRPVAIFDWDNTVLKNDIGDATFFYMLQHDLVLQPPGLDWARTAQYRDPNGVLTSALTPDATAALNAACDSLAAAGSPLPTSASLACADELVTIYDSGTTVAGLAAWSPEKTLYTNHAYSWVAGMLAGYTRSQARAIATAAYERDSSMAIGTVQTVGSQTGFNGYVRIYPQMKDLINSLQGSGFDVWIVSASQQNVVEAVADFVDVDRDHVIGIQNVLAGGTLTYDLAGCGSLGGTSVADGDNTVITFDVGKRCFINKQIFHEADPVAQMQRSAPEKRQVFSAGDSDTDIAFVKDATTMKLAINRNKVQLMCNGYENVSSNWLVQPMFISPKAAKATPYPCTTALDAAGNPIVNQNGAVFTTDFADTVNATSMPVCD